MPPRGRPKKTDDLIEALQGEGQKRVNGYKKIDILVKGLWHNALPKDKEGRIVEDGKGEVDLKAAQFILNQMYGKPVERRETFIDIFAHYPEEIDTDQFKLDHKPVEVEAEVQ